MRGAATPGGRAPATSPRRSTTVWRIGPGPTPGLEVEVTTDRPCTDSGGPGPRPAAPPGVLDRAGDQLLNLLGDQPGSLGLDHGLGQRQGGKSRTAGRAPLPPEQQPSGYLAEHLPARVGAGTSGSPARHRRRRALALLDRTPAGSAGPHQLVARREAAVTNRPASPARGYRGSRRSRPARRGGHQPVPGGEAGLPLRAMTPAPGAEAGVLMSGALDQAVRQQDGRLAPHQRDQARGLQPRLGGPREASSSPWA